MRTLFGLKDSSPMFALYFSILVIVSFFSIFYLSVAHAASGISLSFSTYLGGDNEDYLRDVATDSLGNIYVTGGTRSSDFPGTSGGLSGNMDVFVSKFTPDGQTLIWSKYIGGPNYDRAYAVEIGPGDSVYLAGRAGNGYPTTAGVLQPVFGDDLNPNSAYGKQDGFVTKLSSDGAIVWSTFFGGPDRSMIRDIDVDSSGNAYIAMGLVSSHNPHITSGAYQTSIAGNEDGVVAKISSDGQNVIWASYIGGSKQDSDTPSIRVDSSGSPVIAGATLSDDFPTTDGAFDKTLGGVGDVFVAKFLPDGSDLVYSTYLGGSSGEFTETHNLSLNSLGEAYVTATTKSNDFPTTAGVYQPIFGGLGGGGNYPGDGFISHVSADGSALIASTYIGGSSGEGLEGSAFDSNGNLVVTGATFSNNFPVTSDAYQSNIAGAPDIYLSVFSADLSNLIYSTYLGGSGNDYGRSSWAVGNDYYVGGHVDSSNFNISNAYQSTYAGGGLDGAFAKFVMAGSVPSPTPTPTPSPTPTPTPTATPTPTSTPSATGSPTPTPTATPSNTPSPTPKPPVNCKLSNYGIVEGEVISSFDFDNDFDVYIPNDHCYKRLFLNPIVYSFYGHLSFGNIKPVSPTVRDLMPTSGIFRNCETNDPKVYGVEVQGEDTGILHHIDLTGSEAVSQDPDFFKKTFCINNNEWNWYTNNGTVFGAPYTHLNQIPSYSRN